mmetsp:Transcript_1108/g.2943  ORF Transcript_1108/g.2943 Transcript_1108/m.2943 type:complete len:234 (+) Transcript_1108:648-1349(+)
MMHSPVAPSRRFVECNSSTASTQGTASSHSTGARGADTSSGTTFYRPQPCSPYQTERSIGERLQRLQQQLLEEEQQTRQESLQSPGLAVQQNSEQHSSPTVPTEISLQFAATRELLPGGPSPTSRYAHSSQHLREEDWLDYEQRRAQWLQYYIECGDVDNALNLCITSRERARVLSGSYVRVLRSPAASDANGNDMRHGDGTQGSPISSADPRRQPTLFGSTSHANHIAPPDM